MIFDAVRAAVYAAARDQLQDAILAALDVAESWHRKAEATFGDVSLSGSAQKAEQVADAMAAVLDRDDTGLHADLRTAQAASRKTDVIAYWFRAKHAELSLVPRMPESDQDRGFREGFLCALEEAAGLLGIETGEK